MTRQTAYDSLHSQPFWFFTGNLLYASCHGIREAKLVICFTVGTGCIRFYEFTFMFCLTFIIGPLNQEKCPTGDTFAQHFF